MDLDPTAAGWNSLYRVAAVCALLSVGFMLMDIGMSFTGGDVEVGGLGAVDWFAHFQDNWFLGLRNLGFFNVLNITLAIPLYLVLFHLHHKANPAYSALALILFVLGAAIYLSNNRALSMLVLNEQYACDRRCE